MPIFELELVTAEPSDPPGGPVVQELADALAGAVDGAEAETWVRLRTLPRSQYAENGRDLPEDVEPVFVSVTHRHRPTGADREAEAGTVADTVGEILDRSSDAVHVIYEPDGADRVAFGGPNGGRRRSPPGGPPQFWPRGSSHSTEQSRTDPRKIIYYTTE